MSNIVLVDIDGTLFDANSTFDFLDSLPNSLIYRIYRRLSKTYAARAVNKLSIYIFKTDIIRAIGIHRLRGFSQEELNCLGETFYDTYLIRKRISSVFKMVDEEKCRGKRIILASATMDFLSDIIKRKTGADFCIGTELSYINGICTGRIAKDRLGEKITALKSAGISFPVDLTITDNITDCELLCLSERKTIIVYPKERNRWRKLIKKYNYDRVMILEL